MLSSGPKIGCVLFNRHRTAENRDLSVESGTFPTVMLRPTATGEPVSAQSALRVPEVWSCCRVLSDAASSLPLRLYRQTADGSRVKVISGETFELLARPAPAMTAGNLIGTLVVHLALYGRAWLAKYRDGDGVIAQLGVLDPERVFWQIVDGAPLYTVTTLAGTVQQAGIRDLIHLRGMSLDGYQGLSAVDQCADAIALCAAQQEHAGRFFQNDARPSGLLTIPSSPTADEQVENLRKAWEARHSGASNAHRIGVMVGDVTFAPISMNAEQSQLTQQREQAVRQIARAFRVPGWSIGAADAGSMTYANVEMQQQSFIDNSLRPWLTVIEQAITADSDLCMGSLTAEFDYSQLLRGDQDARASYYTQALAGGWLDADEVRRMEGLPPRPSQPDTNPAVTGLADTFAADPSSMETA